MIGSISYEHIAAIVVALIALAEAVYAAIKRSEVQTLTAEKAAVISFYDQNDDTSIPEAVVSQLPIHTYTMSDATRQFALAGLSPADRESVLQQIADAEATGQIQYVVTYSDGWYQIEYGQISGGGKAPARST